MLKATFTIHHLPLLLITDKLILNSGMLFKLLAQVRIVHIKNYVINYGRHAKPPDARLSRKTGALRVWQYLGIPCKKVYLISNYEFNPSSKTCPSSSPRRRGRDRRSHPRRFRPCLTSLPRHFFFLLPATWFLPLPFF